MVVVVFHLASQPREYTKINTIAIGPNKRSIFFVIIHEETLVLTATRTINSNQNGTKCK